MSSTWLHALRAYAARTNATPASLAARCRLFDQLCAVQLRGLPSAQLHPDALPVLREARWSLLREGTTADKAELLEHIVRQYAQASEKAMYAAPTASCSLDGIRGSADAQRQQPGKTSNHTRSLQDRSPQHATRSGTSGSLLSGVQLSEMSVLQQLLLEQVQCLVEAKVSDIPLSARHYRYPMRSPLLATVSPELPLLLLEELTQQSTAVSSSSSSSSSAQSNIDWEARVDCCVGLVAAGHVQEALALCSDDGSTFRTVMHRVVPLRRDGWRCAWALADAAPLSRVLDDATAAAGGTASLHWLRGVLEAVDMRHRAAVGARQVSDSANAERNHVFEWVDRLRRLIVPSSKVALAGAEGQQQRVSATALRLIMDTYLSVCPASRWRDAVGAVLELAAATDEASAVAQAAAEGNCCADAVTMGRLMSILKAAEQPWMVLLFFYGDSLALQVASSRSRNDSSPKQPDSDAPARWQVSDKSVQAKVEECVRAARDADRLTVATGTILNERDKRHAAIYNHAMVALAATGHHTEAMHFYRTLPILLVNCYTHWSVLQLFLQPTRDSRAVSALRSSENYNHCARALRHLIRMSTADSKAAHAHTQVNGNNGSVHPATPIRCTRDQGGVWESMILWAALRRDTETVDLCATHAPAVSRYAHLIALLSAAASRGDGWSAAQAQVRHMCAAPRTTLKELSLATAAMASFFPRWPAGTTAAELPVRAELFDEVARSMAPLVGRSQSRMDEMLELLVGYSVSLRRRRRMPLTPQDEAAALDDILVKENILANTMDLARPRAGYASDVDRAHHSCDNGAADDSGAWRTVVHVMTSVAERQGLSAARAAPALVSAGVPAEMAIDLLPT
ncbi:conserved hypothetical protein [Leishmania major strain Friedlin]|uniref:Uncharacterized protein n=1 Tax=Leishmania major TaxID=5664 RepID=Q4QJF8_LEIMA|nr:conserved hypothetical protein [Leishmania major strain Friedlin]CAG9568223.1 hypothetical_protein_-_conserved [Leishmania major strain Friedlin]CAJ01964.1 conserved hypothetical protein [Leishmania major strain Friedlin]|eukprot:XP_001687521.1 conserved hypothetical protein [Leishmania major strain Friedlin]